MFAQRFLDRVEETFFNEDKHHKFIEFLQILRSFSEQPQQQQTGAQLYLVSTLECLKASFLLILARWSLKGVLFQY